MESKSFSSSILYISFNQDSSCLALGLEYGYRIYNLTSNKLDFYERFLDGGIKIIEMLYTTNLLVLVGGGKNPKFSKNKIILYDENTSKIITEFSFTDYISNVKIKKDRIFLVSDKNIIILSLFNFKLIDKIDFSFQNKKGLIAVTYENDVNYLAFPDKAIGFVYIKTYKKFEVEKEGRINAHEDEIACINFDKNKYLATSSVNGKYLRIFKVENKVFLYQFKFPCCLSVINIEFDESDFVLCSTNVGKVYVFSLKNVKKEDDEKDYFFYDNNEENNVINNNNNIFKFFEKEENFWAVLNLNEKKIISTFVNGNFGKNKIVTISSKGNYYRSRFDVNKKGENMIKEEEKNLDDFNFSNFKFI